MPRSRSRRRPRARDIQQVAELDVGQIGEHQLGRFAAGFLVAPRQIAEGLGDRRLLQPRVVGDLAISVRSVKQTAFRQVRAPASRHGWWSGWSKRARTSASVSRIHPKPGMGRRRNDAGGGSRPLLSARLEDGRGRPLADRAARPAAAKSESSAVRRSIRTCRPADNTSADWPRAQRSRGAVGRWPSICSRAPKRFVLALRLPHLLRAQRVGGGEGGQPVPPGPRRPYRKHQVRFRAGVIQRDSTPRFSATPFRPRNDSAIPNLRARAGSRHPPLRTPCLMRSRIPLPTPAQKMRRRLFRQVSWY